jgi:hypothetical protein
MVLWGSTTKRYLKAGVVSFAGVTDNLKIWPWLPTGEASAGEIELPGITVTSANAWRSVVRETESVKSISKITLGIIVLPDGIEFLFLESRQA